MKTYYLHLQEGIAENPFLYLGDFENTKQVLSNLEAYYNMSINNDVIKFQSRTYTIKDKFELIKEYSDASLDIKDQNERTKWLNDRLLQLYNADSL